MDTIAAIPAFEFILHTAFSQNLTVVTFNSRHNTMRRQFEGS